MKSQHKKIYIKSFRQVLTIFLAVILIASPFADLTAMASEVDTSQEMVDFISPEPVISPDEIPVLEEPEPVPTILNWSWTEAGKMEAVTEGNASEANWLYHIELSENQTISKEQVIDVLPKTVNAVLDNNEQMPVNIIWQAPDDYTEPISQGEYLFKASILEDDKFLLPEATQPIAVCVIIDAAVSNVAPETVPDTVPDTAPEVAPEIIPEVKPEIVPEAVPEIVPELIPETVPEANAEKPAILPENAFDYCYVSGLKIKETLDGTAPFDADDNDGNDTSTSNRRIRSFDTIFYELQFTVDLKDPMITIDEADLYCEFILPVTSHTATFDLNAMKWLENANLREENGQQILTGTRHLSNQLSNAIPGAGSVNVVINVGAALNGTAITPAFRMSIKDEPAVIKEAVSDTITVTTIPKFNFSLVHSNGLNVLGDFSFTTGKIYDSRTGDSNHGKLLQYNLNVALYNENEDKGLRGLAFPEGDISFDLHINTELDGIIEPYNSEFGARLWDYSLNDPSEVGNLGRQTATLGSIDYAIEGPLAHGTRNWETYDSGQVNMVQDATDKTVWHVTINNYQFDWENYHFPKSILYTSDPEHAVYFTDNIGIFSALKLEVVTILPHGITKPRNLYSDIKIDNFHLTALDSRISGPDDMVLEDNRVRKGITYGGEGWIQQYHQYTKGKEKWDFLSSDPYVGDAAGYRGQEVSVVGFTYGSSQNYYYCDTDILMKFDDKVLEPLGTYLIYPISDSLLKIGKDNVMFAAKPDGTGWTDDAEMDMAHEENLLFFKSLADLQANKQANGEPFTCVGALFEFRDYENQQTQASITYLRYYLHCKIKEDAKPGIVHQWRSDMRIWVNLKGGTNFTWIDKPYASTDINNAYGAGMPISSEHQYVEGYVKPQYRHDTHVGEYKKLYFVDGLEHGHNGYHLGNSLLVIGYKTAMDMTVDLYNEDGSKKKIYDMDKNEREVAYKITPRTVVESANITIKPDSGEVTDVYVRAILPKHLVYKEGSANIAPKEVKNNEDGTQSLLWVLPDQKVGHTCDPVRFYCKIGNPLSEDDVKNNEQLKVKGFVSAAEDSRGPKWAFGNYMEKSISVIKLSSLAINKVADEPEPAIGEDLLYTLNINNSSNKPIDNLRLYDRLPYNHDITGSAFHGYYRVKDIILDCSKAPVTKQNLLNTGLNIYWADEPTATSADYKQIMKDNAVFGWNKVNIIPEANGDNLVISDINADAYAIFMQLKAINKFEGVSIHLVMSPVDTSGALIQDKEGNTQTKDDLYVNAFYQYADNQAEVVRSNFAKIKVKAKAGNVFIEKQDTEGNLLAGAKLHVTDLNGNIVIPEWVSEAKPHKLVGLKAHESYYLVEAEAPIGYKIADKVLFTVNGTEATQTVTMVDRKLITADIIENRQLDGFDIDNKHIGVYKDQAYTARFILDGNPFENAEYAFHFSEPFTEGTELTLGDYSESLPIFYRYVCNGTEKIIQFTNFKRMGKMNVMPIQPRATAKNTYQLSADFSRINAPEKNDIYAGIGYYDSQAPTSYIPLADVSYTATKPPAAHITANKSQITIDYWDGDFRLEGEKLYLTAHLLLNGKAVCVPHMAKGYLSEQKGKWISGNEITFEVGNSETALSQSTYDLKFEGLRAGDYDIEWTLSSTEPNSNVYDSNLAWTDNGKYSVPANTLKYMKPYIQLIDGQIESNRVLQQGQKHTIKVKVDTSEDIFKVRAEKQLSSLALFGPAMDIDCTINSDNTVDIIFPETLEAGTYRLHFSITEHLLRDDAYLTFVFII